MAEEKKKKTENIIQEQAVMDEVVLEKDALPAAELVKPAEEPDDAKRIEIKKETVRIDAWSPKTELGRKVKSGEIKDIAEVLETGKPILEIEIIDVLVPDLESDLLMVGQAKGKFGGGQRRVFKQTQKKTKEGNKPSFTTVAVVGNKNGIVGLGMGKARETVPAREKAFRNAKKNIIKIRRGCGSWQCNCRQPHSIPFAVKGKCGSVIIKLMPAPKGKGLIAEGECQKILKMAGIRDIWSKTYGKSGTKINLVYACESALRKLMETKLQPQYAAALGIAEGLLSEATHETSNEPSEQPGETENEAGEE